HDVVRRREVGLAGTETDDVLPRRFQGLGLGVDGEGGRLRDGANALRDASHCCHADTVTDTGRPHNGIPDDSVPEIWLPDHLRPADGRFGCGPSKVRPEALAALAATGTGFMGTSHRRPRVKSVVGRIRAGLAELL